MNNFKIGNFYNFTTKAPNILGLNYKIAQLMAIVDYSMASMFENVDITLSNIVSYLDESANSNASTDTYLIFKAQTGSRLIMGMNWINLATVEEFSSTMVTVQVNSANETDATRIRQILALAGYNQVTTTVHSVS